MTELDEKAKFALCEQLDAVTQARGFLLLIAASVLLSLWAASLQRESLCRSLEGCKERKPELFPIRLGASALVIGALGFFLCLAIRGVKEAEVGADCAARQSAATNLIAALLVFLAALLRLDDLLCMRGNRSRWAEEDTFPA